MKELKSKKVKNYLWVIPGLIIATIMLLPGMSFGQELDLGALEEETRRAAGTARTVVRYILYTAMVVGLIHVVYAVATSNPKQRDIIISWIVALIVLYVGLQLIPEA